MEKFGWNYTSAIKEIELDLDTTREIRLVLMKIIWKQVTKDGTIPPIGGEEGFLEKKGAEIMAKKKMGR